MLYCITHAIIACTFNVKNWVEVKVHTPLSDHSLWTVMVGGGGLSLCAYACHQPLRGFHLCSLHIHHLYLQSHYSSRTNYNIPT